MVRDFHALIGAQIEQTPRALNLQERDRRAKWFHEEVAEFLASQSIVGQADALADLLYFAIGAFVEMGVPPSQVFRIVHLANMKKTGAGRNLDGAKAEKPAEWAGPETEIGQYINSLGGETKTQN